MPCKKSVLGEELITRLSQSVDMNGGFDGSENQDNASKETPQMVG